MEYKNNIDEAFGMNGENPEETRNKQKRRQVLAMMMSSMTDPNGSYTGVPINPYEKPVQDADDL